MKKSSIDINNLDEQEYLTRSKAEYSRAIKAQQVGLKILLLGTILLFVELFITIATYPRYVVDVLSISTEGRFVWVNVITCLIYMVIVGGFVTVVLGAWMAMLHWHSIGLGFSAVNTMTSRSKSSKNITNEKVADHPQKTQKNSHNNKENSKIEINVEPEYYDIRCPHCNNILSVDKNIEYKDSFTCPYCDGKINV